MQITTNAVATESAGISAQITTPSEACLAGAALLGAGVTIGSIGITTVVAPPMTLIPLAGSVALIVTAQHLADKEAEAVAEAVDAATPVAA